MTESHRCPKCGAELPAAAPEGLCPKCLLLAGFESQAQSAPFQPTSSSPPASGFVPPTAEQLAARFPQLEVLELLGKGGMGAVYKARQPGLDRLVAVKILPPEVGRDPAFAERFTREARALARLNHPNIVSVYDFGQRDGLFYIVMEFVDGVNLRQAIRAGQMSPQDALAVVPQICDALQFAHDEGIVHRDIKPENILLDKRGRVKIADFGLAKLVGAVNDPTLTAEHQVMGTLRYMAPEQLEGTHSVDHRADIYSLGVVFYELLTGELPLGRFAPPSQKVEIDVRLDEVVLRALQKEPEQRYQQASELKTGVANATSRPRSVNVIPSTASSERLAPPSTNQPDAPAKFRFPLRYFLLCSLIFAVAFFAALPLWNLRYPGIALGGVVIFFALYCAAAVGRRRFSLALANRPPESRMRRAMSLLLGLALSIAGYYFVLGGNLVLAERSEWCFIPRDAAAFEQTYTGKEYQLVRQLSAYQKSVPKVELLPNGRNWSSAAILPLFQDVGPKVGLFDSSFSAFFQFVIGFLLLADGALAISSAVWATRKINWRHDIGPLLAIALALPIGWCITSMAASSLAGILQFQHGAGGFENGTSSVFSVNAPLDDVRRTMETALDAEGYQLGDTAMWMMRTVPEGDKIGDTGFEHAWKPSAFDRWHWQLGTLAASCPKVSIQFVASDKPAQTVVQISLGQVSDGHLDREPWPGMFNRLIEAGKATHAAAEQHSPSIATPAAG